MDKIGDAHGATRAAALAGFDSLRAHWPWLTRVHAGTRPVPAGAFALALEGEQTRPGLPSLRFCVTAEAPADGGVESLHWRLDALPLDADADTLVALVDPTLACDMVATGLAEHMLPTDVAALLLIICDECPYLTVLDAHRGGGLWTLRGYHCDIRLYVRVAYDRFDPLHAEATPALIARNAADFSQPPLWRLLAEGDIDLLYGVRVCGRDAHALEPLLQRLFEHTGAFRETDDRALIIADEYDHVRACRFDYGTRVAPVPCTCPRDLRARRASALWQLCADDTMDIDVPDDFCEDEDSDIDLPAAAADPGFDDVPMLM